MTVEVIMLQGGRAVQTQFAADDFNRAGPQLGPNYLFGVQPRTVSVTPVGTMRPAIANSTIDANPCLAWSTYPAGGNNPLASGVWLTHLLIQPLILGTTGKSQFVQCTNVGTSATAGNSVNVGPATMIIAEGDNLVTGYWFEIEQLGGGAKNLFLVRRTANDTFVDFTVGGPHAVANGDILRLEATINSGDVTLVCKKNGGTLFTAVDNTAARLTTGSPGMLTFSNGGTVGQVWISEWRNLSAGVL